jgi:hypothetical protein
MFHRLQGLLLNSAHRRATLEVQSLLHQRRTSTASHQALGGGARAGLMASTTPSSAPCEPPSGFDYAVFCTLQAAIRQQAPASCRAAALGPHWFRQHHVLHCAGHHLAISFGRLLEAAPTTWPLPSLQPDPSHRLVRAQAKQLSAFRL